MKIAIVVETFARDMGYINNTLPKYLARLGLEVHVITTDLPPYYQLGAAHVVFGKAFADRNQNSAGAQEVIDGYTLHTLSQRKTFGYSRPIGLLNTLKQIRPDIVCIFQAAGWMPLECAWFHKWQHCKLVIGSHMGKTVFSMTGSWFSFRRLRSFLLRTVPGWFISSQAAQCVVPTQDCAEIASAYFGVPSKKVAIMNLPVDTDFFYPEKDRAAPLETQTSRAMLRSKLGIAEDELVCIYSGKFTSDKNALVLAQAVNILQKNGTRVRALFIGNGEQESAIKSHSSCIVLPFMPIAELGDYYRAADIGVWMNESISFLDGACCGLPLLLSNIVKDTSHLKEFTSVYQANDPESLACQIMTLIDPLERKRRSELAIRLGFERFSAEVYAKRRLAQFQELLGSPTL